MDVSKLSDADLEALSAGDMSRVSEAGLMMLSGEQPKAPAVTANDRVQATGSGANSGIAGFLGAPVDTALNLWDMAKAGVGTIQGLTTGKTPSDAFLPADRSKYFGSGDYIRGLMNKSAITTTQMNRPEDTASQYLHVGGSALPAIALAQPATVGQALGAATANVVPALAGKATADLSKGTPYETTAPILANLLAQGGVNYALSPSPQKPADTVRRETLKKSQEEGYVVPPSTTNPTIANKLLESVGGKVGTQQDAAARNMEVTNKLARESLGLAPDTPLTPEKLAKLRNAEAKAYEPIKQLPAIQADADYQAGLQRIAQDSDILAKEFPGLGAEEIGTLVKSLDQPQFTGKGALAATRYLRDKASSFYSKGDKDIGAAYRSASNEIEALVERNLAAQAQQRNAQGGVTAAAKQAANTLSKFREARQNIAKTYTVEEALNGSTGNVSATQLGRQLDKGVPLTGELKTAAQFGQAFPKAARQIDDSGSVRNTDVIVGGATAAISKQPAALLYPFSRMAVRDALLSKLGQKLAVPSMPKNYVQLQTPEQQAALRAMYQSGLLSQ